MSDNAIGAPSRELDDFEKLVYEYSKRFSVGNGEHWGIDARACNLRFDSATRGPPATVSFLFRITPAMSNFLGNLHGGCAATLIDNLSTMILLGVSQPGKFSLGGVSRNLKVTYLRPIPTGTEARLVCEVIHVGKRLALLRAEIQKADSGDICVVGEHEKANTDPEDNQRI
ncbi:Thioesterase superfamily [Penicillium bovifimosum]|uniref:Thioesterase superfamily n=1 Tax=Penicillium bovifimosum TaxID=126998 RepID=A0A9W9GMB6_9EURO|nr:Thioesterase superfamily [Penicillium bovifimosum]KAJ5124034.1 Thioesterase superfamily [Penicillium bovifimosum]